MPSEGVPGTRSRQPKCVSLRTDGLPCRGFARRGTELCLAHSPDQAEAASAARSKGAAAANTRPRADTPRAMARLNEQVLMGVLSGRIAPPVATAWFKGISTQQKLHSDTVVLARLEALEARARAQDLDRRR